MKKKNSHKKAFSIIELMIGIFVFALWVAAIYMIISSTAKINTYNKNKIIASNLAREQIELIRNIRDTNYAKLQKWNLLYPHASDYLTVFTWSTTTFYKLESDFTSLDWEITISTKPFILDFKWALVDTAVNTEDTYRLCLDSNNRYIYCDWAAWTPKETPFYRYIEIKTLTDNLDWWWTVVNDALKIRSRVFWNQKWIHDMEVPTILTDWKRL